MLYNDIQKRVAGPISNMAVDLNFKCCLFSFTKMKKEATKIHTKIKPITNKRKTVVFIVVFSVEMQPYCITGSILLKYTHVEIKMYSFLLRSMQILKRTTLSALFTP